MRELAPIDWQKKYSQSSEDYLLRMLLPFAIGHYIEVGVFAAKESNSYIFYEQGWSGLLVEPVPNWARQIQGARPRDKVVAKAISDVSGTARIEVCDQQSTIDPNWLNRENHPVGKMIDIPTIRLDELLKDYPAIRDRCDFVSIDVEGWEKQVLTSIDFSSFKPTVFCIEAVRWNPFYRLHQNWEDILTSNGYKLICHNLQNRFYGRLDNSELWENVKKWNLQE